MRDPSATAPAGKGIESLGHYLRTTHHIAFPQVEYVLWAILLGLIIGNAVRLPSLFGPGLATYELWLKLGIVLVGAKFVLGDLLTSAASHSSSSPSSSSSRSPS